MRRLTIIAVTAAGIGADVRPEADAIERLLRSGAVDRVHIRKPGASDEAVAALVDAVPRELRSRLSLHDAFAVAAPMGVGGIHLNGRNPDVPAGWRGIVSRSCHSFAEVEQARAAGHDYFFLSPIFDSISKAGYTSAFAASVLAEASRRGIIGADTIALGGIGPARLREVGRLGFGGAAMLGAVWNDVDAFISLMHNMFLSNFRLQLITAGAPASEHVEGARQALEGGCRWVQLRMKDASDAEVEAAALELAPLCRRYGATFLLDDRVELVQRVGADGVHLGKNDMPVAQARELLASADNRHYIIGATANTLSDILAAHAAGADYVGLGPFRFTTTKKNLSPLLGLDGYKAVMRQLAEAGISIPVVAIGGITAQDVAALTRAGVDGIAVSGAILRASDKAEATRLILNQILQYNE